MLSVPTIPWEWAEQVVDDGRILVDLKVGAGAGNLVLLERRGDVLEGRFLPGWVTFMTIQSPAVPAPARFTSRDADTTPVERPTPVGPQPWTNVIPWLFAAFDQPAGLVTFDQEVGRQTGSFLNLPTDHGARSPTRG